MIIGLLVPVRTLDIMQGRLTQIFFCPYCSYCLYRKNSFMTNYTDKCYNTNYFTDFCYDAFIMHQWLGIKLYEKLLSNTMYEQQYQML